MKVLIAEDDIVSGQLLSRLLKKWALEAVETQDGAQAWRALENDPEIQLLITDWMMPEMDGLTLVKKARSQEREKYLHIIMLTAKSSHQDLLDGLNAGADTFLNKPFDAAELEAHVRVAKRMVELEDRTMRQLEELREKNNHIRNDLEAARRIQQALLPQEAPSAGRYEFSWVFDSCDAVAGDMLNIFPLDESHVGFYVLDVAGHGVQAALLSVSLSHLLDPMPHRAGLLKRRVESEPGYEIVEPRNVADELNCQFEKLGHTGVFFTMIYGIIDTRQHALTYTRTGHPHPVIVDSEGARSLGYCEGLPIGVDESAVFEQKTIEFKPGDQLFVYTDGVDEIADAEGNILGAEGVRRLLNQTKNQPIRKAVMSLRGALQEYVAPNPQLDDITILGIRLKTVNEP
ncbi:SpoIIE family protein phosphatase [Candidatus Sumerlaeota bacterium]|nr:SpoIIE family protein phosphatase [Candidatus Sumerlaeota bacterium]